jgi:hypothetical protein
MGKAGRKAQGTLSGYAARLVYRLSIYVPMDVSVVGVNQGAECMAQGSGDVIRLRCSFRLSSLDLCPDGRVGGRGPYL